MKSLFLFCFLVFLVGCSSSSEFDYEVDILYEHTVIMIDTSNSSMLDTIGLNKSYIDESSAKQSKDKLDQMVLAFNTTHKESDQATLDTLNEIMLDMMDIWFELEYS